MTKVIYPTTDETYCHYCHKQKTTPKALATHIYKAHKETHAYYNLIQISEECDKCRNFISECECSIRNT